MKKATTRYHNEWLREILHHLRSEDPNLRSWAIGALDDLPPVDAEVIPDLVAALHLADFTAYHGIMTLLARFRSAAAPALPDLMRVLTSKSPWVFRPETTPDMPAQGAMEALAAIGKASVPPLHQALRNRDAQTRLVATWALGKVGQKTASAITALLEVLKDQDVWVRAQAAWALGECGPKAMEAVAALENALADRDLFVRAEATHALSRIKSDDAGDYSAIVEDLSSTLLNAKAILRAKAAHTLGHLGKHARSVVPALINVLEQHDDPPLVEATTALSAIGKADPSIIPALVDIVATRDDALSAEIAGALVGVGPAAKAVLPHLIAKMNKDWPGRQDAIFGFAALEPEPEDVLPILTDIILRGVDPPDPPQDLYRVSAVNSLGVMAPQWKEEIVPVLVRAAYDPVASVRHAATVALGKLALS